MIEVQAWLWLPLVAYAVTLGVGLLAERLSGVPIPNALLAPVGVAVTVVAVTPVYRVGGNADIAAPLVLALAAGGALLSGRAVRTRLWPGPAAAAGLGAYALYIAPVALSGHWTWPGYEFVNDTAANLIFADHVGHHGFTHPGEIDSTGASIAANPIELNYPLGAHFLLATWRWLSGAALAPVYQPAMATLAALAAMSLAQIARQGGLPAILASGAGLLAVASNLLYRYVLHGAIKEILVVAILAAGAALGAELLSRRASFRSLALLILVLAPLPAVFSATGALYGAALALPFAAVLIWRIKPGPRRLALGAALTLAVAGAAVVPVVGDVVTFGRQASQAFAHEGGESTAFLGQLARPLPLSQTAGIWLTRDYRVPVTGGAALPNDVLIGIAAALALAGIVFAIVRRLSAPLAMLLATGSIAGLLVVRLSPYADAKMLVVLSPAVVLLVAIGAFAVGRGGRLRVAVAAAAATAVTGGVLWSAAITYREARLAPVTRMEAMEDVAAHAPGGGLWLVNEWEEYAKYFMRGIRENMPFEVESPEPARLRVRDAPIFGRYYDLDRAEIGYVMSFPGIIVRRSPSASRPPAAYEKLYENRYYEAWRRRPGIEVAEHLPLQRHHDNTDEPPCGSVLRMASRARSDERLVAASAPRVSLYDVTRDPIPGWVLNQRPDPAGTLTPVVAGRQAGSVRTGKGSFRVWIRGTFGRAVSVSLDGRRIGAADELNTPGQWLQVGTAELSAGRHAVELRRPPASLAPGDGYRGLIGPVALQRAEPARLVSVAPAGVRALCERQWDWIERVRGPR